MRTRFIALMLVILAAACGSPQTIRVTGIQLGRSLNADNTVADPTTGFAPNDTVCLSVLTTGKGTATISVRWMYAGRVVDEPKKQVDYRDSAATDFRLQSAGGFPAGDYTAEVFFNGESAGKRSFKVGSGR